MRHQDKIVLLNTNEIISGYSNIVLTESKSIIDDGGEEVCDLIVSWNRKEMCVR